MRLYPINIVPGTIYQMDNQDFLRGMNSNTVDLIATDPPFNTGKRRSQTPTGHWLDIFKWGENVHPDWLDDLGGALRDGILAIKERDQPACYKTKTGSDAGLSAYLCFMADRLIQMHRVLKDTGSIYVHLDPTVSHYVKALVMDPIFGTKNFRNEVVWSYRTGGACKTSFSKKHDSLLFYSKGKEYAFNVQHEKSYTKSENRKPGIVNYGAGEAEFFEDENGVFNWVLMRDVWEIPYLGSTDPRRTGYEDQKPPDLYKRIILASSNPGDLVMDPFCGCGTTGYAAHHTGRQFVGCDMNPDAKRHIVALFTGKHKDEVDPMLPGMVEMLLQANNIRFETTPPVRTDADESEKIVSALGKEYWRPKEKPLFTKDESKERLIEKWGIQCMGCGCDPSAMVPAKIAADYLEVDHIVPRSKNGPSQLTNYALLCRRCNQIKLNKLTLKELRKAIFGFTKKVNAAVREGKLVDLKKLLAWAEEQEQAEVKSRGGGTQLPLTP